MTRILHKRELSGPPAAPLLRARPNPSDSQDSSESQIDSQPEAEDAPMKRLRRRDPALDLVGEQMMKKHKGRFEGKTAEEKLMAMERSSDFKLVKRSSSQDSDPWANEDLSPSDVKTMTTEEAEQFYRPIKRNSAMPSQTGLQNQIMRPSMRGVFQGGYSSPNTPNMPPKSSSFNVTARYKIDPEHTIVKPTSSKSSRYRTTSPEREPGRDRPSRMYLHKRAGTAQSHAEKLPGIKAHYPTYPTSRFTAQQDAWNPLLAAITPRSSSVSPEREFPIIRVEDINIARVIRHGAARISSENQIRKPSTRGVFQGPSPPNMRCSGFKK